MKDGEFRLDERITYVVKQLHACLARLVDDTVAPAGLTRTQFAALTYLHHHGPLSGADLARADLISPQAAGTLLDRLVQRGLVERRPRPGSRRDLQAHLTAAGRAAQQHAARLVAEAEDRLTAELGTGPTADLLASARRLIELSGRGAQGRFEQ